MGAARFDEKAALLTDNFKKKRAKKLKVLFKYVVLPSLCGLALILAFDCSMARADQSVLKGRISDVEGRAIEGARLFVYDSPAVRRPADFICGLTGKDGLFRLVLPPGKYWAVARIKKTEGYGPLMPGDKHSGEPAEIDLAAGREVNQDFIVADIREVRRIKTKDREGPVKITGRVLDEKGSPVAKGYAVANRTEKISGIPDYVSAWVDAEGRYALYLPPGKYYLGIAATFPPDQPLSLKGPVMLNADRSNLDIFEAPAGSR